MRNILFRILFSFVLACITAVGVCQSTPSALGDSLFTAIKTNSLSRLDSLIPSARKMLQIAKSFTDGQNLTEKDIKAFNEKYPEQKNMLKEQCLEIIKKGKRLGVDWQNAQIKKIATIPAPGVFAEQQKDTAVELKGISVIFSSGDKSFALTLWTAVAVEGKWYIGDSTIDLFWLKK